MTKEQRIEAAARAWMPQSWGTRSEEVRKAWREELATMLTAAFPELFSDSPTHWLAPLDINGVDAIGEWVDPEHWSRVRDAYLKGA